MTPAIAAALESHPTRSRFLDRLTAEALEIAKDLPPGEYREHGFGEGTCRAEAALFAALAAWDRTGFARHWEEVERAGERYLAAWRREVSLFRAE